MECVQRECLQKIYTTASISFDARTRLQQGIGICPKSEFWVLCKAMDQASDELKRARAVLDPHIPEHCCMVRVALWQGISESGFFCHDCSTRGRRAVLPHRSAGPPALLPDLQPCFTGRGPRADIDLAFFLG